jgi:hypothetical protein
LKLSWCNLDCMEEHWYAGTIAAVAVGEVIGKSWEGMEFSHQGDGWRGRRTGRQLIDGEGNAQEERRGAALCVERHTHRR